MGFFQVDDKLLKLGLNAFEIACFCALQKHSDHNGSSFPSHRTIALVAGMSERQVRRALETLQFCNIVIWDRGSTGRANTYRILGAGCWTVKIHRPNRPGCSATQADPGRPIRPPNHTHLNQIQLTKGTALEKFNISGDLLKKIKDRAKKN